MSLDSAKALIERMKSDKAFAKRVLAVEDVAGRFALFQSEGFLCTDEEIKAVSEELTESQLDTVAGGICYENRIEKNVTFGHSC